MAKAKKKKKKKKKKKLAYLILCDCWSPGQKGI